ncbi:LPS export ABC transporter periplasmic protein LptC [Zhengella mangrovi]|uniref:LPS export ABC transporter periplasmic protein LptC n=1 Tax=Zhengella mangrovi TaxID=1982044 RepID=A0A2G1QTD3_9HYPH|nr:LPS export ABC transporter periplasmic protein LptC [Zhengella mangrovi]PHP68720.1 LPS export ABC transporter periplasmic protein LptC [Zhengella mangrovi]
MVFGAYSWIVTPGKVSIDVASSGFVDGKLIMASPKLDGYTKENRAYSMTASRAIQQPGNMDQFDLEDIVARLPLTDQQIADVTAATGSYDNKSQKLIVDSPISIATSDGLKAKLKDARIDVGSGTLETEKPVDIRLDGSVITADSMQVKDNGKVLVFDRNVKLTLEPQQARERRKAETAKKD